MSQINIGAISEALNNKADDTSVVHKEYSETIPGTKTFSSRIVSRSGIDLYSLKITKGTDPESIEYWGIRANDNTNSSAWKNTRLGVLEWSLSPEGVSQAMLAAYKNEAGSEVKSSISVIYDKTSGTGFATAPTPSSATDNSTKIATTAHVVNVLKAIYPVGSVYIGTQNTCPMSAFFGTWTLVSSGKALWTGTGSNGNSTIDAGLPNITGRVDLSGAHVNNGSGALSGSGSRVNRDDILDTAGTYILSLDASKSNAIYGKSSTVQPPAYVVNVWRRTA
mgnify:CR=1 FL=1